MTSSAKSELEVGKSRTQTAEESTWQCVYPNERRERNQVYTLLNISEKVFEQDERSLEYVIRTGWEEAVQGWGKAAPFACLQFQKQAKKSRASETVNSCLFCLDMRQTNDKSVSQETKTTREQSKLECKLSTCDDTASEKKEVPIHSSESTTCSATDGTERESCNGKLHSLQTCQGEKKSLPLKEYSIWHPEKVKKTEALHHKAVKTPEPAIPAPDSIESENLMSLLVLPPVKDATPKDSRDPSLKKSKAVISQANHKMSSATSPESASNSKGTKPIEQKGDKETKCFIHDTVKEKKNHEPSPFIPRLPKASFLPGGPEQIHWHCALWPDRKIASASNTLSLRKNSHLATMEFLHTKGIQCTKHDESRAPFTNSFKNRSLATAKQGNESKTQAMQLLPGLFPSLTVKDWDKDAPLTCYQVQKKSKKPKRKEIVSYLPRTDIAPVTKRELAQAIQSTKDQSKPNYKLATPAIGDTVSGKEKVPAYCNDSFDAPMTDSTKGERNNGKLHSTQLFQGEKSTKNLQGNMYNKRQPEKLINKTLEGKGMRLPHLSHGNPQECLRCMTLKILLVLPPLKEAVPCSHLESYFKKRKAISTQGNKRSLNAGSNEAASYIKTLKVRG